jgi:phospholipid/cholesterol/gamma-HCH transport system substrate-binding protein
MSRSIKVGIFVLAGLLLAGVASFMIGDDRQVWDRKVAFHAAFRDVAGLKPGSPVRMGGIDVGTVAKVQHGGDVGDPRIHVTISVVRDEAARVRTDTKAQILGKGLLGDKMVDLSSDGTGPEAPPGADLATSDPMDLTDAIGGLAKKADATLQNVQEATGALNDPRLKENVKASAEDLRLILDGVARQDTAVHRLLMDPTEGPKIDQVLARLDHATNELDALVANARVATDQINNGPGLAHALLYDGEISKNAAGAIEEVHKDLEAVRTGNGLAHALLYGDSDSQRVMGNLNGMSDDLRAIVHDVRQGKGTLGALLVDPSLYDDIRSMVGNVERNEVLRALVRYSIKADEGKSAPRVTSDSVAK